MTQDFCLSSRRSNRRIASYKLIAEHGEDEQKRKYHVNDALRFSAHPTILFVPVKNEKLRIFY